jgi:membrane-bound lytic murein transglycosylase MltF
MLAVAAPAPLSFKVGALCRGAVMRALRLSLLWLVCVLVVPLLPGGTAAAADEPVVEPPALLEPAFALPAAWFGDLDGMAERRLIRVATTYSKTNYFLDGLTQRGATYELMQAFEQFLNEELETPSALPVRILFVPVDRERLLPALVDGHADIAAANLTVTDARRALVDFAAPLYAKAREVVVTGPAAPPLASLDDLAGTTVHLRPSSSYWESVEKLNEDFAARGLAPVTLHEADPWLEDEDLLEMVAAGILPWLVVDEHKATLWVDVIPGLELHDELALREDAAIAWALRKQTPELMALVDRFVQTVRKGTATGNILFKRYYAENKWMRSPGATEDYARFQATADLFRRYGQEYGFDWLMLAAQGYQESRIDQSVRSPAGAVGIMQLLPSTAADPSVGVQDIHEAENNVHAGARYLRLLVDRYLDDPAIDDFNRTLFGFAAYNAGPGNLQKIRRETAALGLDPNVWFGNAEIGAAKVIGRETPTYVANIAKYYYAYRLIEERREAIEPRG